MPVHSGKPQVSTYANDHANASTYADLRGRQDTSQQKTKLSLSFEEKNISTRLTEAFRSRLVIKQGVKCMSGQEPARPQGSR